MKKMREVNFICYVLITYILSSLYGIIFRLEVPEILKFENLINLSVLFLLLLITGYLITNFFKSLKEVFRSGVKKLSYVFVIIYGVNINNIALIYAISICLIVAYAVLFLETKQIKKKEKTKNSEKELYPSRRNLVEVLNHALGEYSLIALDGTWGSGKTTFMNIFMRDKREKYYYIPVNVMLFENRSSLKTEFLNQLKGIFKEEGIFQGSLMDFDYYLDGISNDWVKIVKNIIFSKSKSFKEANEKLKREIGKIEKRIVVGVDNLERIYGESEPEWKQILGFIHELQELGIKIIVMANLEEMLATKKETGEKDLSNHEYFDKFYEFKLKLNEVTTEEIVDEVEIKKDKVNREWLKNQIKELTNNLDEGFKSLESKPLSENKNKEEKNKSKEIILECKELQWRYLSQIKNPRKIEKLMKDIETKKENIKNIFNFIDDEDYKKLIFRTSVLALFYFDYTNNYKKNGYKTLRNEPSYMSLIKGKSAYNEFYGENIFFEKLFNEKENFYRARNRLLYYDSKEDLIKKQIKKLITTKEINLSEIDKTLKNLDVYSSTLDPDFDQKTTKKAYKIIEPKLIELENSDKKKVHEIIKGNEEFICKMNYLCYPNEVGIYEKVDYKFGEKLIFKFYRESLENLERVGYPNDYYLKETKHLEELAVLIERVCALTHQKDLTESELEEIKIGDIKKLKEKINNRNKNIYFYEKAEKIIFI